MSTGLQVAQTTKSHSGKSEPTFNVSAVIVRHVPNNTITGRHFEV